MVKGASQRSAPYSPDDSSGDPTRTSSTVFNSLFARQGRFVVYTSARSMDAAAPSIPKSIDLTDLALKTVS